MNDIKLTSKAELYAEKAESLKAFSGLKLLHVKRHVAVILGQIGRDGIFDEYTKHDISHIDYMLDSLDWIIPLSTWEILTPADWLMITLSIYFHDLGMLVTKDEFENRSNSAFSGFKQSIIKGDYGLDYRDKILGIVSDEKQDRFVYQELVRKTHAERIKNWILDEQNSHFTNELAVINEIKKLISNLDEMFKRDLAIVCESHHLSDLDDFDKYKVNQQYGPSRDAVVNLQYCALILRTADLLHITSDRTPSIEFNLINPTDPISQEEWSKQMAVKVIRPQAKRNRDGIVDENIPKDTFEVIALFADDKGFFGLISYIDYANKELKESFKLNEQVKKQFGTKYDFPWRFIDDSSIETKDFEKRQFEFVLDQTKILDLLVGHTLYNDSTVVLRELSQNGIDAARLKKYEVERDGSDPAYSPDIKVIWKSLSRELSFIDNGTGMTLEIIQNHLLKVGSSRYQDESFKKAYPEFSAISRFGIGLLTCFLIADDIDIITKSAESDRAILLKIKKLHGKYLLKYLSIDKIPTEIRKHGTEIKLYVRGEVELDNIDEEMKKWIVIPNCNLSMQIDDRIVKIGFRSPKETLETYLLSVGFDVDNKNIKVQEIEREGMTLAFALRYVEHWKEWEFLELRENDFDISTPIGTCVEGIKVDFNTPGFRGRNLYALINTSGKKAPKTNVARSNIELTPEKERLLELVYTLYLEHIIGEIENIKRAGFSITWAANEANWMLNIFSGGSRYSENESRLESSQSFENALSKVKCILIERSGKREIININELKSSGHFWTIDCASYYSADSLIKEVKASDTSALALLSTIFGREDSKIDHIDCLLCIQQSNRTIDRILRRNFQVDIIKIIADQRRLDLRWTITPDRIWEEIEVQDSDGFGKISRCYIQLLDLNIDTTISQIAIKSSNVLFILKNSELNKYLIKLINKLSRRTQEDRLALSHVVSLINNLFYYKNINSDTVQRVIETRLDHQANFDIPKIVWGRIDKDELIEIILKTSFIKYDTTIWFRREMY